MVVTGRLAAIVSSRAETRCERCRRTVRLGSTLWIRLLSVLDAADLCLLSLETLVPPFHWVDPPLSLVLAVALGRPEDDELPRFGLLEDLGPSAVDDTFDARVADHGVREP